MFTQIPARALSELKVLVEAASVAKQRCDDFARALALVLNVDLSNPNVGLDLSKGGFVTPEPPAPEPAPEEPYIEVKPA